MTKRQTWSTANTTTTAQTELIYKANFYLNLTDRYTMEYAIKRKFRKNFMWLVNNNLPEISATLKEIDRRMTADVGDDYTQLADIYCELEDRWRLLNAINMASQDPQILSKLNVLIKLTS